MAYIDAAFHGIATIGSDNGGISDAIINEFNGLICKSGDQVEITKNLERLLDDVKFRNQLGKNGHKLAKEKYTWERKVHEYLNATN